MLKNTKSRPALIGGLLAALSIGGAVMFGDRGVAQEQAQPQGRQNGQITSVGTYQPQSLFRASEPGKKLTQNMQSLQRQIQQSGGDQQKLKQLQTQAQQQQQQAVKEFTTLVEQAVPKVAQEQGVQVIAVEVTYTAPGVQTKDITSALVEEMSDKAGAPQQQPLEPGQPAQPRRPAAPGGQPAAPAGR